MVINQEKYQQYIELSPGLLSKCKEYLYRRGLSEKTNQLYLLVLEDIFKKDRLTQTLYNDMFYKGSRYKAVLNIIKKTCYHFDIPIFNYKAIVKKQIKRKAPQIWSENDILRMANTIEDYGLLIESAYYIGAGLRFSSAIFLKWEHFMWDEWIIDKDKAGKCLVFGKGRKEKYLDVHPILMNRLHSIAQNKGKVFLGIPYKNSSEDTHIFIDNQELLDIKDKLKKDEFNEMLDISDNYLMKRDPQELSKNILIAKMHDRVAYKLRKIKQSFNDRNIKFHSIRSSRATNLLKNGFSLLEISKMLMHEDIKTTQIYLSIEDSEITKKFNERL
jgi:integrase